MTIDPATTAAISAPLLAGVAAVYLAMAFGLRRGELIWSGSHVGRLPTEQRIWSFLYGLVLLSSGVVLVQATDVTGVDLVPERWLDPAVVAVFLVLGVATLVGLVRGSRWERFLFAPITLLGSGLAYWIFFG